MRYLDLENKIRELLEEKAKGLSDDAKKEYLPLAEKVAEMARDVIEGAIMGEDVDEDKVFLEATMQNMVSAAQAITVREVKDIFHEAVGIILQTALKAALAAIA